MNLILSGLEKRLYWDEFKEKGSNKLFAMTQPWLLKSQSGIHQDSNIYLAVFFRTACFCKCLMAFPNGFCNIRRQRDFSRAIDVAKKNGKSGSIIEEFGVYVGGSERESVKKLEGGGQWVLI